MALTGVFGGWEVETDGFADSLCSIPDPQSATVRLRSKLLIEDSSQEFF